MLGEKSAKTGFVRLQRRVSKKIPIIRKRVCTCACINMCMFGVSEDKAQQDF